MTAIGLDLAIVALLILFNGVLAMSELAVVSSRKIRLQQRAEQGNAGARAALLLADEPNRFLSTVQIGITMVGILAGAFGGATLAETVAARLIAAGLSESYGEAAGVALVVLAITYFSLVIGELVPKRLALQHPETIAAAVAGPMRVLSRIAAPAVTLLTVSTDGILRLLGHRSRQETPVSEEEIRLLIQQSTAAGIFEDAEEAMVTSIFRLGDRRVEELMTPRPNVVWLDINDPPEAIMRAISNAPHARLPVCRDDLDDVLGVVAIKDVWMQTKGGHPSNLDELSRPALFVPETLSVLKALDFFKQAGARFAVVIDEYGGTSGVITLDDVFEAIVGDIPTLDTPVDSRIVRRDDGSWLIDGLLATEELKARFLFAELPDEDEYQTVAGFILLQLGRIPRPGEAFDWGGHRFEVLDMDGNRIDKVLVIPPSSRHPGNGENAAPSHPLEPPVYDA